VRELNLGIDFSFKKDVVTGSIEYYSELSTDLYGSTSYDYTTFGNTSTVNSNVAILKGQGVDVVLRSKNIDKGLKWATTILFNYNTSKTIKYFRAGEIGLEVLGGSGNRIRTEIGLPLYAMTAWKWGGLDANGDPQGYVNGQLSSDYDAIEREGIDKGYKGSSIRYIGAADPPYFGSVSNQFTWRKFSLSINMAYRLGYYFKKPFLNYKDLFDNGRGHPDFARRWQKSGDELITDVPAMVYFDYPNYLNRINLYNNSDIHYLKADHIRIQYINIKYTISRRKVKHPFENLQLYWNISNLGVIWRANREKIDPMNPGTSQTRRSFTMGVTARF
jgi:hypothetical protein